MQAASSGCSKRLSVMTQERSWHVVPMRLQTAGVANCFKPCSHAPPLQDPLWLDSSARLHWALKQSGLSAQAWSAATGHGTAAVAACAPGPPTLQQPSTTTTTASATAASAAASAGSCSASLAHRGAAWPSVQIAMQDMLLQAARQTGVPSEAWDATASILRSALHRVNGCGCGGLWPCQTLNPKPPVQVTLYPVSLTCLRKVPTLHCKLNACLW